MKDITNTAVELAPQLVASKEAAKMLAISLRKLWALTNCSELRCVRIGRAVRYDVADLQRWVEANKTGGHAPRA